MTNQEQGLPNHPGAVSIEKPEITFCQTDRLVLVSIMVSNVNEDEVNVLLEADNIQVELSKYELENPILAGKLSGAVRKDSCRVRVKEDSILIKLRKDSPGRWNTILDESSNGLNRALSESTRIQPVKGYRNFSEEQRAPIEPSFAADTTSKEIRGRELNSQVAELVEENATIKGVLNNMKKTFNRSNYSDIDGESVGTVRELHQIMPTASGFGVEISAGME